MVKSLTHIVNYNREMLFNNEKTCAIWFNSKNWGDAVNPVLIQHFSGKKPFRITKYWINLKNEPIYAVVGSILDYPLLTSKMLKNTIIWGSGFVADSGRLQGVPKKICAVRGPLTRNNIIKTGIKCPEIYGDPALLYSKLYKPNIAKKYKLGIIPHYTDKENNLLKNFKKVPEIKLIDIAGPINSVVDEICSCKYIASSSLHGIIVADSYNVPSLWIKFSDNVWGEGFKFRDYFGSVRRLEPEPLVITEGIMVDDIYNTFYNYKIDIDLNELLEVCPFYNCEF
jgi:pyruvyltransferase